MKIIDESYSAKINKIVSVERCSYLSKKRTSSSEFQITSSQATTRGNSANSFANISHMPPANFSSRMHEISNVKEEHDILSNFVSCSEFFNTEDCYNRTENNNDNDDYLYFLNGEYTNN